MPRRLFARSTLSVILTLPAGACAIRSPSPIVTANGYQGPAQPMDQSTYRKFIDAYSKSSDNPDSSQAASKMLQIGSELEFQLCSEFFTNGGQEEQRLMFVKDLVALLGTVSSGVLGATRSSPAAVAFLGLGSATAISGINTYQRDFLFSEDNIQSVQTLTLNALDVARSSATADNFTEGVSALMQVQSICQPQKILSLVRDAIKTGKPQVTGTADALQKLTEIELGRRINGGLALSDQQLQALYWYFLGTAKTPAANSGGKLDAIKATLLLLTTPPIDTAGKPVPSFPKAFVVAALQAMSQELSSAIAANIDTAAAGVTASQPATEAVPFAANRWAVVPAMLPNLGVTSGRRRIDVQIR